MIWRNWLTKSSPIGYSMPMDTFLEVLPDMVVALLLLASGLIQFLSYKRTGKFGNLVGQEVKKVANNTAKPSCVKVRLPDGTLLDLSSVEFVKEVGKQ